MRREAEEEMRGRSELQNQRSTDYPNGAMKDRDGLSEVLTVV